MDEQGILAEALRIGAVLARDSENIQRLMAPLALGIFQNMPAGAADDQNLYIAAVELLAVCDRYTADANDDTRATYCALAEYAVGLLNDQNAGNDGSQHVLMALLVSLQRYASSDVTCRRRMKQIVLPHNMYAPSCR